MGEEGLSPKDATRKSMGQITGALVGIALVLSAVFVPMAFFGGSTGVIYRQFSITIVSAMVLSVLVALILTPALCATLLKPLPRGRHARRAASSAGSTALRRERARLRRAASRLACAGPRGCSRSTPWRSRPSALLFVRLPTSFLPDEDQGILYGQVQAPPGATQERTWIALDAAQRLFPEQREGHRRRRAHRRRLQLRRHRPELRARVREAQGLEPAQEVVADRAGARGARRRGTSRHDARRDDPRNRAARRHGARQRDRLRHEARRTAAA